MSAAPRTDPLDKLRTDFASIEETDSADRARRESAFARFTERGFPAANEEAWKYTPLRRLESRAFAAAARTASVDGGLPTPADVGGHRLLVVDGQIFGADAAAPPAGLRLLQAKSDPAQWLDRSRTWPAGGGTERFAALNAAFALDPILIDVDAVEGAVPLLHLACVAHAETRASHPRVSVRIAAGARLRLVLEHTSDARAERWVNAVVDVAVGIGAQLDLYRLQRHSHRTFHTERVEIVAERDARVAVRDASLGGTLARLDLHVTLAGVNASAEVAGLFLADGNAHVDTQVRVDHRVGHTTSEQDYRGIAAGRGRGVFNTTVFVHEGAAKSNARQTSRNLLLTTGAEIDTKPELQIHTDDVQCSHGATTGQLDPNALFYLRSRGLDAAEARRVLTRAFAASVLTRMDLAGYETAVHELIDARLGSLLEPSP
jgi:Fe-S cluster assembly protein SufD